MRTSNPSQQSMIQIVQVLYRERAHSVTAPETSSATQSSAGSVLHPPYDETYGSDRSYTEKRVRKLPSDSALLLNNYFLLSTENS